MDKVEKLSDFLKMNSLQQQSNPDLPQSGAHLNMKKKQKKETRNTTTTIIFTKKSDKKFKDMQ